MFILSTLIMLAYLAGLLLFLRKRYLSGWLLALKPEARQNRSMRLALYACRLLGFLHAVCFFIPFIFIPLSAFLAFNQFANPQLASSFDVLVGFRVDLSQLDNAAVGGLHEQVLSGKSELRIDSPNAINSMLFLVTGLIKWVVMLYVILHLRNMLVSFCNGDAFAYGNSRRLNNIGKVLVLAYVFGPIWHWFLSASVYRVIKPASEAITFQPVSDISLIGIAIGISLLILSAVIREAESMREEQELTV